jgi:hypothetical protein
MSCSFLLKSWVSHNNEQESQQQMPYWRVVGLANHHGWESSIF